MKINTIPEAVRQMHGRREALETVRRINAMRAMREIIGRTPQGLRTIDVTELLEETQPVILVSREVPGWLEAKLPNGNYVPIAKAGERWVAFKHELEEAAAGMGLVIVRADSGSPEGPAPIH